MKDILDSRVRSHKGYRLQETVLNLKDRDNQVQEIINELEKLTRNISEKSLQESLMGRGISAMVSKLITVLLVGEADAASGELGGIVLLLPALAKNAWELSRSNKKIKPIIEKVSQQNLTPKDVNDLEKLVAEIKGDLGDLINAVILALPGFFGTDTVGAAIATIFDETAIEKVQSMRQTFNAYRQSSGMTGTLCKIIGAAGYFVGGDIIGTSLINLEKAASILAAGGVKTIEARPSNDPPRLEDIHNPNPDSRELKGTPIQSIPDPSDDPSGDKTQFFPMRLAATGDDSSAARTPEDVRKGLSESNLNLKRWQKLSGLI
jgi:hypothetical protein